MTRIFGEQPREESNEVPQLIIPESYNKPNSTRKEQDLAVESEKREEEQRRGQEEGQTKMPRTKKEFSAGSLIIGGERRPETKTQVAPETTTQETAPKLEIFSNMGERKTIQQVEADKKMREDSAEKIRMEKDIINRVTNGETISLTRQERQFAINKGIINSEKGKTPKAVILKTEAEAPIELSLPEEEVLEIKTEAEEKAEIQKELLKRVKNRSYEELKVILAGIDKANDALQFSDEDIIKGAHSYETTNQEKAIDSFIDASRNATWRLNEDKLDAKTKGQRFAYQKAREQGRFVGTREEFITESTEKRQKQEKMALISDIVLEAWHKLPEHKKELYNNQEPGTHGVTVFSSELDRKREELEKKGVSLSQEAYYSMIKSGINPSEIKAKKRFGFFGKKQIIFKGSGAKKAEALDPNQFAKLSEEYTADLNQQVEDETNRILNEIFDNDEKVIKEDAREAAIESIRQTRFNYEKDLAFEAMAKEDAEEEAKKAEALKKSTKVAPKVESRPKLIAPEVFENKRTPEQSKAYGEMIKQIEEDTKRREKTKKRITELKNKQKKELLTAGEIAWLNTTRQELKEGKV